MSDGAVFVAFMALMTGALVVTFLFISGIPEVVAAIVAAWLGEREKTRRILAEARLIEAQNAARTGGSDAP